MEITNGIFCLDNWWHGDWMGLCSTGNVMRIILSSQQNEMLYFDFISLYVRIKTFQLLSKYLDDYSLCSMVVSYPQQLFLMSDPTGQ